MFYIVALIALRLLVVAPMSEIEAASAAPARTEGILVAHVESAEDRVISLGTETNHETMPFGETESGSCQKCTVIEESSANPGSWILSWGALCKDDKTDCADCRGGAACDNSQSSLGDGPCDIACCGSGGGESRGGGGCGEQLAVDSESATAVSAALKKHSVSLALNTGRRALQVVSCSGQVLQSVPLRDDVFNEVANITDQSTNLTHLNPAP